MTQKTSEGYREDCRGLSRMNEAARLSHAREIIEQLASRFDAEVCGLLLAAVEGTSEASQKSWLAALPETPNAAWLRAQLLSDDFDVASAWREFFSFQVNRNPFDVLAWSRALAGSGDYQQALKQLRLALFQRVSHTFLREQKRLYRS